MASKQADADAFLRDLDAKGITYTVTSARPAKQPLPTCRAKLTPDARWADRPDFTDLESVFEVVPVRTENPLNGSQSRAHWSRKSKRANREHEAVRLVLLPHREKLALLALGCTVTLTRLSAGRLDPIDALGPALKNIRDAIAQIMLGGTIGQLDESELITWKLEQRTCGRGIAGVTLLIEPRT